MPFRAPKLSTIERELYIAEANKRQDAWRSSEADRVYGSKRLRRKAESKNPSNRNGFTAYCNHYGFPGAKAAESWDQLGDEEKKTKWAKHGRTSFAHHKSTDAAALSSLSEDEVVGPLGSCDEHLPFSVNSACSLLTEDESLLSYNSVIVGESIPLLPNNGMA